MNLMTDNQVFENANGIGKIHNPIMENIIWDH